MPDSDTTSPGLFAPPRTVQVLLPLPVPGPYDYAVPEDLEVPLGAIVRVPNSR